MPHKSEFFLTSILNFRYNLDVFITHKSFKDGLAELASGVTLDSGASWPPLKAVFMGTRRTDPHGGV